MVSRYIALLLLSLSSTVYLFGLAFADSLCKDAPYLSLCQIPSTGIQSYQVAASNTMCGQMQSAFDGMSSKSKSIEFGSLEEGGGCIKSILDLSCSMNCRQCINEISVSSLPVCKSACDAYSQQCNRFIQDGRLPVLSELNVECSTSAANCTYILSVPLGRLPSFKSESEA